MGTFIYTGPEAEARNILAPFFNLNPPVSRVQMIPFYQVPSLILMGMIEASSNTKEGVHSIHTLNARKLSAETYVSAVDKFDTFYHKFPAARSSAAVLETFSTAAPLTVPDDATAYPWREAVGNLYVHVSPVYTYEKTYN